MNVGVMALPQSQSLTPSETAQVSTPQPMLLCPQQGLRCRMGQVGFQRVGYLLSLRLMPLMGLLFSRKMAAVVLKDDQDDQAHRAWQPLPHVSPQSDPLQTPQATPVHITIPPPVPRVNGCKQKVCTLALEKGGFVSSRICLSLSDRNPALFTAGCYVGAC